MKNKNMIIVCLFDHINYPLVFLITARNKEGGNKQEDYTETKLFMFHTSASNVGQGIHAILEPMHVWILVH